MKNISSLTQLLTCLFLFMLGSQLLSIYISLLLALQGHTSQEVSIVSSFGFLGLGLAGFNTDRIIHKYGLIPSFIFCGAATSILSCLFFLAANSYATVAYLRLFLGLIVGFMYVVTATWLGMISSQKCRSTNLAYYMLVLYSAQSLSPFLLLLPKIHRYQSFICAGLLTAISIIPALWHIATPVVEIQKNKSNNISLLNVIKKIPVGFFSSILSGISIGSMTSLIPYYAVESSLNVTMLIASFSIGGALGQYPWGYAADRFNKEAVLAVICLLTVFPTFMICCTQQPILIAFNFFIFGGLIFSIYPISISLAHDYVTQGQLASANKALLFAWSVGAFIGTPVVAFFMELLQNNASLIFINAFLAVGFALWTSLRKKQRINNI